MGPLKALRAVAAVAWQGPSSPSKNTPLPLDQILGYQSLKKNKTYINIGSARTFVVCQIVGLECFWYSTGREKNWTSVVGRRD